VVTDRHYFHQLIFDKSVTNAAKLGAAYGVTGGLAHYQYNQKLPSVAPFPAPFPVLSAID